MNFCKMDACVIYFSNFQIYKHLAIAGLRAAARDRGIQTAASNFVVRIISKL